MDVLLLAFLVGLYLALGLTIRKYTPIVRLFLVGVTAVLPVWFYFFW